MIIMFCGIPGSGKSTIAELLSAELACLGSVETLSSDKLRGPVYRKLLKAVQPQQRRSHFLILDATFYDPKLREEVTLLAQGEKVVTVYLDCPLQVALERNRARPSGISERAVHIVFHRMKPPQNPSLKIDTAATPAKDAAARIFEFVRDHA